MSRNSDSAQIDLAEIFLRVQRQMLACLAVGEAFEHPSACGAASEQGWIDLFNRYLPQRYRASPAFVVDADGRRSRWLSTNTGINISGKFYCLCSIQDGCSRYIDSWDLRKSMTEADIEIILERAKEPHPEAKPRIISDNRPQFIAKDFKEFIRISGMTHVRISPYYPQSNGKIERWHKSLKGECIRPGTPLSLDDVRCLVEGYVDHDNNVRLNSAVGYITPKDMLAGRRREIHAERDRKLEVSRKQRQVRRQQAA